jgi:hypothetical protein
VTPLIGVLGTVGLLVLGVFVKVLGGLAAKEAQGWIPRISEGLIRRAASRLPNETRGRWVEEQLRHHGEYGERPISMLLHAVDVVRSSRDLRKELGPALETAPVPAEPTWRSALARGRQRLSVIAATASRLASQARVARSLRSAPSSRPGISHDLWLSTWALLSLGVLVLLIGTGIVGTIVSGAKKVEVSGPVAAVIAVLAIVNLFVLSRARR